jgi:hypothetical protein
MDNNIIQYNILYDINNNFFDFKKLLTSKDTLNWKKCNNLKINVDSKINKMFFENCKNINIQIHSSIIGLEFNNCINIKIKIKEHICCIESYKSTIECSANKKHKFKLISEKSKIIIKYLK